MALVTVQRSPSSSTSLQNIDSTSGSVSVGEDIDMGRNSKSLSECYFAGKGTALVLPAASEAQKSSRRSGAGSNIQRHLQSMFYLLRPEETLKMAVKLESAYPVRTRYLVVVSRMGVRAEESCLLGIDCNEQTTVGLVLRVLADTAITLDGDGGFSVTVCGRHHIFKPVSVQAMWSALQTLHKVSSKAREQNYFQGGVTHAWVSYYEGRIKSERSCLNEWHAMDNLESRRPPSPDSLRTKPTAREETEQVIKSTLKEIMMSVDLDEVTSKYIRTRLEDDFDMDLGEFKSFIDQEMLTILGQMDAPTEIFEHVYLGSEWNASNYEELQRNGVGHILNVTREIDNFFPGMFDYLNVRVCDDEQTDLLRHWDNTFKYITNARRQGSKVLVHCKMGVSRSASVVIAYAMKAYDWNFAQAMAHVKGKRTCIKPNASFMTQLEMYQGILDAMKNRERLQRSKSETHLVLASARPLLVAKNEELMLVGSEPTSTSPSMPMTATPTPSMSLSGIHLRRLGVRPKSWSPDNATIAVAMTTSTAIPPRCVDDAPIFRSLENLNVKVKTTTTKKKHAQDDDSDRNAIMVAMKIMMMMQKKRRKKKKKNKQKDKEEDAARNVLLPCDNGESYSVSPNQIMHIPNRNVVAAAAAAGGSVKERVSELESKRGKQLVLNLSPHFEQPATWDPGDRGITSSAAGLHGRPSNGTIDDCDLLTLNASDEEDEIEDDEVDAEEEDKSIDILHDKVAVPELRLRPKVANVVVRKDGDMFSSHVDRVFDREERKQHRDTQDDVTIQQQQRNCPSRQSSWSSYDSAVGLGRETPSRHSSWGSGDTRTTLPSRNSSWGSYDMRNKAGGYYPTDLTTSSSSGIFPYDKEDIPWNPGTVKRTKQRLEENSRIDAVEALHASGMSISSNLNISTASSHLPTPPPHDKGDLLSVVRLSVSAPEQSSMQLVAANNASLSRSVSNVVGSRITFLENLHRVVDKRNSSSSSSDETHDMDGGGNSAGIVQSLKKEFEAMNSSSSSNGSETSDRAPLLQRSSAPTSPTMAEKPPSPTASDPGENVKELRDKFEKSAVLANRFSCVDVSVEKSPIRIKQTPTILASFGGKQEKERNVESEFKRPPMVPVVRNALLAQMQPNNNNNNNNNNYHNNNNNNHHHHDHNNSKKQQQQYGKSHPLAQLSAKQRHNAVVYNTM